MGQRFQFYVRYSGGERMVARHLQWCYGDYSISRASQLLNFISRETNNNKYSMFLDTSNKEITTERNKDMRALEALIDLNAWNGSYQVGCDLFQEANDYYDEFKNKEYIIMNPLIQDNNDGIFVIDVIGKSSDDMKIKCTFDLLADKDFIPCTAKEYFDAYKKIAGGYEEYKNGDEINREYWRKTESMIEYIDSFEQLTAAELKEMFDKKYLKKDILKEH